MKTEREVLAQKCANIHAEFAKIKVKIEKDKEFQKDIEHAFAYTQWRNKYEKWKDDGYLGEAPQFEDFLGSWQDLIGNYKTAEQKEIEAFEKEVVENAKKHLIW